ncbi:MAG: capsule biosynthesis protein, partial [Paracoccus sp. (in: a-proteobacteria)]
PEPEAPKHPAGKRAARPAQPRAEVVAAAVKRREASHDEPAPRPPVSAARIERRHVLLTLSFILLVIVPTAVSGWYLWTKAEDQYVSTVGFSVRKEDSAPAIDVLGGLTQLAGGSSAADTDILYDFLRSEDIVARIDAAVDLRGKFSKEWPNDPVFAYDPSGTIEDLTEHWQRQVRVLYDTTTQLITLRVAAYSPEDALAIAKATFEESSRTINRLSDIARDDATRFARDELARAQEKLTGARQALTAFRMRTQIVDPTADLAGQMGILNTLQASLAETLIELDTLRENATDSDQRVIQTEKKIEAIRNRISEEREKFSASSEGPGGENYAELMAEYEKLASDLLFDQTAYQSAQAAYDSSLAEAQRQSRYLAAHIEPKLAEASVVPDRPYLLLVVFGAMMLGWSILLLIYYSLRDRR